MTIRSQPLHVLFGSFTIAAICFTACSSGGGGDDGGDSSGDSSTSSAIIAEEGGLKTTCGVVVNGKRYLPIATERGELVTISGVVDSNVVTVESASGSEVVKLHALGGTGSFNNTEAEKVLGEHSAEQLYLFRAGCTEPTGAAGEATVGQLVTASGSSLSEEVIRERIGGVIESSGDCNQAAIAGCYKQMIHPSETTSGGGDADGAGGDLDAAETAGEVSNFLWKPDSESPYNPGGVSILLNPCNARVFINGEEIRDYGGTNGRCVTARSAKPGCEYGKNVKVEAIDSVSGLPFGFDGEQFLIIPDGCDRVEFNEGAVSGGEESVDCDPAPPTFKFAPSAPECSGNAAIILSGDLAGAFSVQLRRSDGGDRLDEECGDASCSPFKVQHYIDGAGVKTACFGAPGDAIVMSVVRYATVKMAGDDHDPGRYCIPDARKAVN